MSNHEILPPITQKCISFVSNIVPFLLQDKPGQLSGRAPGAGYFHCIQNAPPRVIFSFVAL